MIVFLALALLGCPPPIEETDPDTDSDTEIDTDTDTDTDTDSDSDTEVPSHAADVQPIWDDACTMCHGQPKPVGDLDLTAPAWGALVGQPSAQADMPLVTAGDLEQSYLWHKLQGTQDKAGGSGDAMPRTGSISAGEMETIRAWIAGGAPE